MPSATEASTRGHKASTNLITAIGARIQWIAQMCCRDALKNVPEQRAACSIHELKAVRPRKQPLFSTRLAQHEIDGSFRERERFR
jgi:hypothetical protein